MFNHKHNSRFCGNKQQLFQVQWNLEGKYSQTYFKIFLGNRAEHRGKRVVKHEFHMYVHREENYIQAK